jgi:putative transposase
MKVNRVEQTIIRKQHPMWKTIDTMCFHSKNLYNYVNYIIKKELDDYEYKISYELLNTILKGTWQYKNCMSQPANSVLRMLDKNWKSYFVAIRDWKENPKKYLSMPSFPKYLKKNGRYPWCIPNNTCYIKDGEVKFKMKLLQGYIWKTNANGRLIQVRFVPKGTCYVMEVVTEVEIYPEFKNPSKIISIDLGVNNFATISNNIGLNPIIINGKGIKSINQFYNKRRSEMIQKLNEKKWSNALSDLTTKRFNRIKNIMHHASKYVVNYCLENDIDTVVCGLNIGWKQRMSIGKRNNQKMHFIPFNIFISQLEYKCQEKGINFITTDEAYTSGTSFLDKEEPIKVNYNKKRRIKRGLFKSNNKTLINADVNGSLQIMKKVFPNAFADGIVGCLIPSRVNLVCC